MEDIPILLVGDVRYTERAKSLYSSELSSAPREFLLQLLSLMEEHGIVKIDVSWDGLKIKHQNQKITHKHP